MTEEKTKFGFKVLVGLWHTKIFVVLVSSEEPTFDLAVFFVSADPIYCFKIQKYFQPIFGFIHKLNVLVVLHI